MFEGKTFLPLQGMPIVYRARSRTKLADWLPDPLTVPTRMARSLTEEGDNITPSRTGCLSITGLIDDMVTLKGRTLCRGARVPTVPALQLANGCRPYGGRH